MDESIGLITAANEVVQDPTSVGTALKTLSLRLRGAKTELEEAGLETENMAETTATLQKKLLALTGGKVDIMLDADTFKNSTQILREMASAWEDMTDIQRAAALELMGGKRQANILSSIIQNFDTVESVIEASANSSNSALEENAKWMDSIEGHTAQFSNAYQTMWNNLLGSDIVKNIVDIGTGLVQLVDKLGLVGVALVAIGAWKGFKYLKGGTLVADLSKLVLGADKAAVAAAKNIPQWISLGKEFGGIKGAALGAADGFSALWKSIPTGGKIMLIAAAIAAVVAIVDHFHKSTEDLAEELQNLKSELSEIQSELGSLNTELETTQSRMKELLAMDSLSFTEQEELKNLQKENDALERQIYLLEQRQKRKQKETEETFVDTVSSDLETRVASGVRIRGRKNRASKISVREKNDRQMEGYQQALLTQEQAEKDLEKAEQKLENAKNDEEEKQAKKEVDRLTKEYNNKKKETKKYYDYITGKIEEYAEYADDIDYDSADDKTKELLDYVYDFEDKFNVINGEDQAKTIAIKNIFNKKEFDDVSDSLDKLKEKLRSNPGDTSIIAQIEEEIKKADIADELKRKGLEIEDAIDYWSSFSVGIGIETDLGSIWSVFDNYASGMEGLASLQAELANGFVITAQKAREFAATYPEILAGATTAANGQIQLNSDVVNSFINGKKEELGASVQAKIQELEAEKALLTAQMSSAQTQLEMAKGVAEGKADMTAQELAYRVSASDVATKAFIDMGIDEATAHMLATMAMSENEQEFNRIVGEVTANMDENMAKATKNAATNIYNSMNSGSDSVISFLLELCSTYVVFTELISAKKFVSIGVPVSLHHILI